MRKYRIIWNGEPLETRFHTLHEAELFAFERYRDDKNSIDRARSQGDFCEDYPEYEIEAYETSEFEEWKHDLQYSINPGAVNPYDIIDPPFEDTNHPPCPYCTVTMSFHWHDDSVDFSQGEGFWKCPNCNFSITETELKEDD